MVRVHKSSSVQFSTHDIWFPQISTTRSSRARENPPKTYACTDKYTQNKIKIASLSRRMYHGLCQVSGTAVKYNTIQSREPRYSSQDLHVHRSSYEHTPRATQAHTRSACQCARAAIEDDAMTCVLVMVCRRSWPRAHGNRGPHVFPPVFVFLPFFCWLCLCDEKMVCVQAWTLLCRAFCILLVL